MFGPLNMCVCVFLFGADPFVCFPFFGETTITLTYFVKQMLSKPGTKSFGLCLRTRRRQLGQDQRTPETMPRTAFVCVQCASEGLGC